MKAAWELQLWRAQQAALVSSSKPFSVESEQFFEKLGDAIHFLLSSVVGWRVGRLVVEWRVGRLVGLETFLGGPWPLGRLVGLDTFLGGPWPWPRAVGAVVLFGWLPIDT